jgi:hypothetical protein
LLKVPVPEVVHSTVAFSAVAEARVKEGSVTQIPASGPADTEELKASVTVTTELQVDTFPLPSLAVTVTVTVPRSAHVNDDLLRVTEATLQLSVTGAATRSAGTTEPLPAASRKTVAALQVTEGGSISATITLAFEFTEFPEASVAVTVTRLNPRFAQVKTVLLTVAVTPGQLSVIVEITSAAVIVAVPEALRLTVIFLVTSDGGSGSVTVMLKEQLAKLPEASVTVYVTAVTPFGRKSPGL